MHPTLKQILLIIIRIAGFVLLPMAVWLVILLWGTDSIFPLKIAGTVGCVSLFVSGIILLLEPRALKDAAAAVVRIINPV